MPPQMSLQVSYMHSDTPSLKVLVIHGPNLNILGKREPDVYGSTTLSDIDLGLKALGKKLGIDVETCQFNSEGEIVDKIQQSRASHNGLILNPAAYTHTSVAIRDALLMLSVPIVEVHISNTQKREPFRHKSLVADVVTGSIVGLGPNGYNLALRAVADLLS